MRYALFVIEGEHLVQEYVVGREVIHRRAGYISGRRDELLGPQALQGAEETLTPPRRLAR